MPNLDAITERNIVEFETLGATMISNFFSEQEMQAIDQLVEDGIKSPSSMRDIFEADENGRPLFFNDFNNWRRIPSIRDFCLDPKLGSAVKKLLNSDTARLFHDHLIVKEAGTTKATPWHIDKTYYMVDGPKSVSLWTPTTNISANQSLRFAARSHKGRRLLMPKSFDTNSNLENDPSFEDYNKDSVEQDFEIVSWPVQRGDTVAFSFYTLHSAPACDFTFDRKVFSVRFLGDDAHFDSRVKNPAPPFTQMGYKSEHGAELKDAWFPKI